MDINGDLLLDDSESAIKQQVLAHLDDISIFCGVDVFLLGPKIASLSEGLNTNGDAGRDQRWRVAIYGDMESAEHAKTRVLILIDRLVSAVSLVISLVSWLTSALAWACCGCHEA